MPNRKSWLKGMWKLIQIGALVIVPLGLYAQKAEILLGVPSVDPYGPGRWYAFGDVVTVYGRNLSSETARVGFDVHAKELAGVMPYYIPSWYFCDEAFKPRDQQDPWKILACGTALDLLFVSPNQINFVLPWNNTPTGGLFLSATLNLADYGFVALVRDGKPDLYLYQENPGIWMPQRLNAVIGARPHFVVLGYTKPFSALSQKHELVTSGDQNDGVFYAALTHLDSSLVSVENPVKNGGIVTAWFTGFGDMVECGGLLCAADEKARALIPTMGFRFGGKDYTFVPDVLFVGATKGFPWLQQMNLRINMCAEGTSTNKPQIIDGRLYIGHYSSVGGRSTVEKEVLLPLVMTGTPEQGQKGLVYQPNLDVSFGTWKATCLQY